MSVKYPIEYKIIPDRIDKGSHWITLELKNIGEESLSRLEIELNSRDTLTLSVNEPYKWLSQLNPHETEVLPFKVNVSRSTNVYITLSALVNDRYFYWESPEILVNAGLEVAELKHMFILSKPYTRVDEDLEAEGVVESRLGCDELLLEFWLEYPFGALEKIGEFVTGKIDRGEEVRYKVEFIPHEKGKYKLTGYLYHKNKLIDKAEDSTII